MTTGLSTTATVQEKVTLMTLLSLTTPTNSTIPLTLLMNTPPRLHQITGRECRWRWRGCNTHRGGRRT